MFAVDEPKDKSLLSSSQHSRTTSLLVWRSQTTSQDIFPPVLGLGQLHLNVSSHMDEQECDKWKNLTRTLLIFTFFICLENKNKKMKELAEAFKSQLNEKRKKKEWDNCREEFVHKDASVLLSGNASIWKEKQMFSCKHNRMISSHPTFKDLLQVQLTAASSNLNYSSSAFEVPQTKKQWKERSWQTKHDYLNNSSLSCISRKWNHQINNIHYLWVAESLFSSVEAFRRGSAVK